MKQLYQNLIVQNQQLLKRISRDQQLQYLDTFLLKMVKPFLRRMFLLKPSTVTLQILWKNHVKSSPSPFVSLSSATDKLRCYQ